MPEYGSIDQAEQSRTSAEQRLQEYEAKLKGAAQEAEAILTEARNKSQRMLEENEQRLRAESERIKAETTQEIDRERRQVTLQKEVVGLLWDRGDKLRISFSPAANSRSPTP